MRRTLAPLVVVLALAAVLAPNATADGDPASPLANSPTGNSLTLSLVGAGREDAVVVGQSFTVHGIAYPFQAGQLVTVTFTQRGKVVQTSTLPIAPAADGSGVFDVAYAPHKAGQVTVSATTTATAVHPSLTESGIEVTVLGRHVSKKGSSVRELQRLLARKGYVVGKRGVYDGRTARAVMAFRKVTGMKRSFNVDKSVVHALAKGRGTFRVKYPKDGRHVEADLSRQVMVFADGAKVERIYHISSGKPSTPTVLGRYRVYRKDFGTNAKGMVDASYFIRGYAIHGYAEVPPYNASHGCLRVPVPDAKSIYDWVHQGTRVDTYK